MNVQSRVSILVRAVSSPPPPPPLLLSLGVVDSVSSPWDAEKQQQQQQQQQQQNNKTTTTTTKRVPRDKCLRKLQNPNCSGEGGGDPVNLVEISRNSTNVRG